MKVFFFYVTVLIQQTFGKLNGQGQICGRPKNSYYTEGKIVGGYDVGYYKYQWYAALIAENYVACGGSLIGSKTILTAAHCYKEDITGNKKNPAKLEDVYNVSLGVYNFCELEKSQKSFTVDKVIVHEKYKDNIPYFDIALLVLKQSTENYEPICLPKNFIKKRPSEGSVPGLGTLKYHGASPCTLHEARLLIYSDAECRSMLKRTGNDPNKLVGAFCGGYLQGGIDTCQGDSGGPFQIQDEFGNYILLGLVSFGFHCANPNLLGIYTDVSNYTDWIQQKAGFNVSIEPTSTESSEDVSEIIETTTKRVKHNSRPIVFQNFAPFIESFVRPFVNIILINDRKKKKKKMLKGIN